MAGRTGPIAAGRLRESIGPVIVAFSSKQPGESAADRARRALVTLAVGPSRITVLTVIGSVMLFVAACVIGYFTRQ